MCEKGGKDLVEGTALLGHFDEVCPGRNCHTFLRPAVKLEEQ
jgi:hypothetical protein